jgi:hypothetical protein
MLGSTKKIPTIKIKKMFRFKPINAPFTGKT